MCRTYAAATFSTFSLMNRTAFQVFSTRMTPVIVFTYPVTLILLEHDARFSHFTLQFTTATTHPFIILYTVQAKALVTPRTFNGVHPEVRRTAVTAAPDLHFSYYHDGGSAAVVVMDKKWKITQGLVLLLLLLRVSLASLHRSWPTRPV